LWSLKIHQQGYWKFWTRLKLSDLMQTIRFGWMNYIIRRLSKRLRPHGTLFASGRGAESTAENRNWEPRLYGYGARVFTFPYRTSNKNQSWQGSCRQYEKLLALLNPIGTWDWASGWSWRPVKTTPERIIRLIIATREISWTRSASLKNPDYSRCFAWKIMSDKREARYRKLIN